MDFRIVWLTWTRPAMICGYDLGIINGNRTGKKPDYILCTKVNTVTGIFSISVQCSILAMAYHFEPKPCSNFTDQTYFFQDSLKHCKFRVAKIEWTGGTGIF